MGAAIIGGIIKSGTTAPGDIAVFDIDGAKADRLAKEFGVSRKDSVRGAVEGGDIVIIAVKPQDVETFLAKHKDILNRAGKTVISIAAGLKTGLFRKYLDKALIVRVMPNTPMLAGEGAAGIYFAEGFEPAKKPDVIRIFESCGIAEEVSKEELLDSVTGLSGSGPAYVYMFISALTDAGVQEGLPRAAAKKLAAQTVLGAAKLARDEIDKGTHLEELKDRVMSPGGTTAAGVHALEKGSFRAVVMDAVRAATARSREKGA
jgi:pyrroline-5-carboxylate reductase